MINDRKYVTAACLVIATPMLDVGRFSASIVSHSLGEALQCLWSGWSLPSGTTSKSLQVSHASPVAIFFLIAGDSFGGNVSRHRLQWEASKLALM